MKEINGLFVDDTCEKRFAAFLSRAIYSGDRVMIIYKKGWEDFTGYHGGDGLHHSVYVRKSIGTKPIPLSICSRRSIGGGRLITCSKAIDSYYTK